MPVSGFHRVGLKETPSLRLHLPGLMRNIDIDSLVCTKTSEWHNSTYKTDFLPFKTLPQPYYLMRRLMVAYHYPDLPQPLRSELETLSHAAISAWSRIECYLSKHSAVSRAHHIYDCNVPRTNLEDLDEPPVEWTDMWDFTATVYNDIFLADAYNQKWKPGNEYYAHGCSLGSPERL